jgi:hypothetical protein
MRDDEITLRADSFNDSRGSGMVVTATVMDKVSHQYRSAIIHEVMQGIADRLIEEWLTAHSAEVLEQIAPGALANTIREGVEKRIAERIFQK